MGICQEMTPAIKIYCICESNPDPCRQIQISIYLSIYLKCKCEMKLSHVFAIFDFMGAKKKIPKSIEADFLT